MGTLRVRGRTMVACRHVKEGSEYGNGGSSIRLKMISATQTGNMWRTLFPKIMEVNKRSVGDDGRLPNPPVFPSLLETVLKKKKKRSKKKKNMLETGEITTIIDLRDLAPPHWGFPKTGKKGSPPVSLQDCWKVVYFHRCHDWVSLVRNRWH